MVTMFVTCENCNHQNKTQKQRKPRSEQILYELVNNFFSLLQEPKNKYELLKSLNTNYKFIEKFLNKHISFGNIKQLDYNPNKYMLTMKGRQLLDLVQELNKFITTWESDIVLPHDKIGNRFVPI